MLFCRSYPMRLAPPLRIVKNIFKNYNSNKIAMSTFEVTSELYAEAEFCSTDSDAVSKFTFTYPNPTRQLLTTTTRTAEATRSNSVPNARPETTTLKTYSGMLDERDMKEQPNGSDIDEIESESEYDSGDDIDIEAELNDDSVELVSPDQSAQLQSSIGVDKDGDLIVARLRKGVIEIEHRKSTVLNLVGLQIWRGALLLADYILHNERKFRNSHILELGSGVGLTSIVSSMYAREVICTDIDIGGLLDLLRDNIQRNVHLSNPNCRMSVCELDFNVSYQDYPRSLKDQLQNVQYVLAADVIYDDDITEAFVRTLVSLLLELPKLKAIYIALEKRYVFTLEDMDSVAPCYDYFLRCFQKRNNRFGVNRWKLINVCMNFPRYFDYDKVKDLVLLKICHATK
ncbi:methyltransferase-like protein 22 isoform X2 [Anopheles albimanus]|uniref:methyltransferase-like protein 22 isoform X2 n=1 Tax=Anopheles albimanus TaxID=7167 RepID=UPI00163EFBBA|nr:methyltransferase-like protein 22 isoform X2 [Anopheles albimanus]